MSDTPPTEQEAMLLKSHIETEVPWPWAPNYGNTNDTIDYSTATEAYYIDGGHGNDVITGTAYDDWLVGGWDLHHVWDAWAGGWLVDLYNDGNDIIYGGAGNDAIHGWNDNDKLYGEDGNDYLSNGYGKALLDGGAGNDFLAGGELSDTLTGGTGADTFWYKFLSDSSVDAPDLITDFSGSIGLVGRAEVRGRAASEGRGTGEGDKLDLSSIDADMTTEGTDEAFTLVKSFTGKAGEVRFEYDKAADLTRVFMNTDADIEADMAINISGQVMLQAADFIF